MKIQININQADLKVRKGIGARAGLVHADKRRKSRQKTKIDTRNEL